MKIIKLAVKETQTKKLLIYGQRIHVQLAAKKTGNENVPNVNLVLSICQLIVYLTISIKYF
jgi:hypothetical protein